MDPPVFSDFPAGGSNGDPRPLILGIPGSVRAGSLNVALLRAAAEELAPRALLELFEQPVLAALPSYEPAAAPPEATETLRSAVEYADGVLIATPEYNGTLPGALKNAIDWAATPPRRGPFRGKPVAVVGTDRGSVGCDWAHADVRKVLEVAGARVVSRNLSIDGAEDAFTNEGALAEATHRDRLRGLLDELLAEATAAA